MALLRQELMALRELQALQASALDCLNQGAFSGLMELVQKQEGVQLRIAHARKDLAPMLKTFEALPLDTKHTFREQGVAAVLAEIEQVAHAIQGRHQVAFPDSAIEAQSANKETATTGHANDDLQDRLARFRNPG
jgi:hypothetical protein